MIGAGKDGVAGGADLAKALASLPEPLVHYLSKRRAAWVAFRRMLHRKPELGFQEVETSAHIAQRLSALGYAVSTGIGGTGVVGTLVAGQGPRRLGLRADMDALPIHEQSGLEHASVRPGVMHACGHDGHVAMLLAAAEYLAEARPFSGTLHLFFQPAEETLEGARRMLADGVLARFPCDAVFGLHTLPGEPQGTWLFRPGETMASADYLRVCLRGRGGHAAHPHKAQDTVVAAASCILALQTVVSRNLDPTAFGVVSVVSLDARSADNVIPAEVRFTVGIRALDAAIRAVLLRRVHEILQAQAAAFGLCADVESSYGCPVLRNDARYTAFAREVAARAFGPECVHDSKPRTGSEDFSYFLEHCPGCFLFLGAGRPGMDNPPLHHDQYDFNDDVLMLGASYWIRLVEAFLEDPSAAAPSRSHSP